MTAQCCTGECVTVPIAQSELFLCRVSSREDDNPPKAAELFREAGIAIAVPLVVAFLITLASSMSVVALP